MDTPRTQISASFSPEFPPAMTQVPRKGAPAATETATATKLVTSDRLYQGLLTFAVAGGLVLSVMAFLRYAPARRRRAPEPPRARAKDPMPSHLREMAVKDALPAHEVTELLSLLKRYRLRLYWIPGCPACMIQKTLLANFSPFIEAINCSKQKETCVSAKVTSIPTWDFPEGASPRRYTGLLRKKDLLNMLRRLHQSQTFGKAPV